MSYVFSKLQQLITEKSLQQLRFGDVRVKASSVLLSAERLMKDIVEFSCFSLQMWLQLEKAMLAVHGELGKVLLFVFGY